MKNVIVCGYRDWAYELFCNVDRYVIDNCIYVDDKNLLGVTIDKYNPVYIFFIGWSWIIKDDIINNYDCICLHPSPLPKYRGGSPLQHQIINGETESAVTLFKMDSGIDTGDILFQNKFSLLGDLKDIYNRMSDIGTVGVIDIIENGYQSITKQNENDATFYKRRKPSMSEIKIDDFNSFTAEELYNKIRSLQYPYPNAYIVCKDGTKLLLTNSKVGS
jgi:methionyl-tRNA formyltransferase